MPERAYTVQISGVDGSTGPVLAELYDATPELAAGFVAAGAFTRPTTSRDAALLINLAPGNYTVEASARGAGGGFVLVEVYEVP